MVAARLLLLAFLLSACGYKGAVSRIDLNDPSMARAEAKALRAEEAKRVAAALAGSAQDRPVRVDELTVKLEVREDDPFSLPPE